MPVPSNIDELLELISQEIIDNTSGLIEEHTLRLVLNELIKILDAKISLISPDLTAEQLAIWKKLADFKASDSLGIITSSTIFPDAKCWGFAAPGTYANADGTVIAPNNIGIITYDGSDFSVVQLPLPQATQYIGRFIDSTFPLVAPTPPAPPIQKTHENIIYELKPGETATITDLPTNEPSKWVNLGLSFKEFDIANNQLFDINTMVIDDTYLNMSGDKDSFPSWKVASINVSDLNDKLSVSGNPMTVSSYWRFADINGNKLTFGGDGTAGSANPQNIDIPTNAVKFEFNIKRPADLNPDFSNIMVNYGSSSLPFEPYIYKTLVTEVENTDLGAKYIWDGSQFVPSENIFDSKKIRVNKTGDIILIRTYFNDVKDLVFKMSLNGSENGASNYLGAKLISKSDEINFSGEIIHDVGDSLPPFQINTRPVPTQYFNVGGNHGMQSVADVTATAHGRDATDLLSEWEDENGRNYFLTNILSANSLRFISKLFLGSDGLDKIWDGIASPLFHVSGATHTNNIIFTSGNFYEYKPCLNSISVKLMIDDELILSDGNYKGDSIKIIDTHNVADITQPNLVNPYLPQNNGTMAKNTLIHSFNYNGVYSVEQLADWQKSHRLTNQGIIQPEPMNKGSYTSIIGYFTNVAETIDFTPTTITVDTFLKTDLIDQDNTIEQFSQILFDGSNPKIGGGFGYNPLVGVGKSSNLLSNTEQYYISANKKIYPRGKTGVSGTDIYRGIGYFAFWDASKNPKLSADYYINHGDFALYFINIRQSMNKEKVYLPSELLNKSFEIIHYSDGLNIHTQDLTTDYGLIVTGGINDWCVLKIK